MGQKAKEVSLTCEWDLLNLQHFSTALVVTP